jgi:polysaccharide export outer membrane protein
VVEVTFTVAPEFNQTLTVQPDGYVMLKDAAPLQAQGLSMPEFIEAVERAYRGYLHNPEAAVALKDFQHPYLCSRWGSRKTGQIRITVGYDRHRGRADCRRADAASQALSSGTVPAN